MYHSSARDGEKPFFEFDGLARKEKKAEQEYENAKTEFSKSADKKKFIKRLENAVWVTTTLNFGYDINEEEKNLNLLQVRRKFLQNRLKDSLVCCFIFLAKLQLFILIILIIS